MRLVIQKEVIIISFLLGVTLLIINIAGLLIPLRNDDIFNDKDVKFDNDVTLSIEQFNNEVNRTFDSRDKYISNLTWSVGKIIAHYWYDQGIDKYNLRVPFYENYILYIGSFLVPEYFLKYEFMDYRRAINRGVGFCSQATIVLTEVLREKGLESKVVGLTGHILATAPIDEAKNKWWVFDPDYGVTLPYDLNQIEEDPDIIRPYYRDKGYDLDEINHLVELFDKKGNSIKEGNGIEGYGINLYYFEKLSYFLKWFFPVILISPLLVNLYLKHYRKN